MNTFYQDKRGENFHLLNEEESKHSALVLRQKVGDEILVLDGAGGTYQCRLTTVSRKGCQFEVLNSTHATAKPYSTHLIIAPTKNIDRIEWLVEKCCEIGVDEISLVRTIHSERKHIRMDRLLKKAISALKQSKNPFLPKINEMKNFSDVLEATGANQKFIAHVSPNHRPLHQILRPSASTALLIGPEGDFSTEEVTLAQSVGFTPVSLGTHTLRTETAGFVACCFVNFCNQY